MNNKVIAANSPYESITKDEIDFTIDDLCPILWKLNDPIHNKDIQKIKEIIIEYALSDVFPPDLYSNMFVETVCREMGLGQWHGHDGGIGDFLMLKLYKFTPIIGDDMQDDVDLKKKWITSYPKEIMKWLFLNDDGETFEDEEND